MFAQIVGKTVCQKCERQIDKIDLISIRSDEIAKTRAARHFKKHGKGFCLGSLVPCVD